MRYYILEYGHSVNPADPGFATLAEAREALVTDGKEMLAAARRRWKQAALIVSPNCRSVYATKDTRSAFWGSLTIIES